MLHKYRSYFRFYWNLENSWIYEKKTLRGGGWQFNCLQKIMHGYYLNNKKTYFFKVFYTAIIDFRVYFTVHIY